MPSSEKSQLYTMSRRFIKFMQSYHAEFPLDDAHEAFDAACERFKVGSRSKIAEILARNISAHDPIFDLHG